MPDAKTLRITLTYETMKSKFTYFILINLISLLHFSCGMYRQNVANTPLFQKKGELQAGGHIGFTGYDGQIAASLTNHIAFATNYSNNGNKKIIYSPNNYSIFKHSFFEIGGSYYYKNQSDIYCDLIFFGGRGMSYSFVTGGDLTPGHTPPFTDIKQAYYNRFLFQSDFGKINKKFEYILSPAIFLLHYYDVTDNKSIAYKSLSKDYLYANLTISLHYKLLKYLKLSGQLNLTAPLSDYTHTYYEFSPINMSLGIIFNADFKKNKTSTNY